MISSLAVLLYLSGTWKMKMAKSKVVGAAMLLHEIPLSKNLSRKIARFLVSKIGPATGVNGSKGREFNLGFRNSVFWFPGIITWKWPEEGIRGWELKGQDRKKKDI